MIFFKKTFFFSCLLFSLSISFANANSVIWTNSAGNAAYGYPNFVLNSPASELTAGQSFKVTGSLIVYTCTNSPAQVDMTYSDINSTNENHSHHIGNQAQNHTVDYISTNITLPTNFSAPSAPGYHRIYLTISVTGTLNGQADYSASGYIEFHVSSQPAPTVSLVANPQTVYVGNSTTLTWSSTNANSCTKSMVTSGTLGDSSWSGSASNNGSGVTQTYNTTGTYTYKIECTGSGGSSYSIDSVSVINPPAATPTVTLTANPTTINVLGGTSNLVWSSTNADSCQKTTTTGNDSSWPGTASVSGNKNTKSYIENGTYTYKITCSGSGGTVEASATVVVNAPDPNYPTVSISASPVNLKSGNSSVISWSSTDASKCTQAMLSTGNLDDSTWTGQNKPASGNQNTKVYTDAGTYTYKITCYSLIGSAEASVNVNVTLDVPSPTVTLTSSPSSVYSGDNSVITWSSTNANSCTKSMVTSGTLGDSSWSGSGATSGNYSKTFNNTGVYIYKIECTGLGGTVVATTSVTVNSVPLPSINFYANPQQSYIGSSTKLFWTSSNSLYCDQFMVTNGTYNDSTWGKINQAINNTTGHITKIYNATGTYTYKLSCTGKGGTSNALVSIEVLEEPVMVGVNLIAIENPVYANTRPTLKWIVSGNPTNCIGTKPGGSDWLSGYKDIKGGEQTLVSAINSTTTYEIKCSNVISTATSSVTVGIKDCEKVQICDYGPCITNTDPVSGVITESQDVSCHYESIDSLCSVDPEELNETRDYCLVEQHYDLSCKAQHGNDDFNKVFVGKIMKWVVTGIDPKPALYNISYKLDPPMTDFNLVSRYIDSGGSFYIPYTYNTIGEKKLDLEITTVVGNTKYIGTCSTSTIAVPYTGVIIEE